MVQYRIALVSLLLIAHALTACKEEEIAMPLDRAPQQVALEFARALASRDYATAHAMTTKSYGDHMSVEELQTNFEAMIPLDWGETEPIELGETMNDWPGKQDTDVGWFYVSIYGDVYSEAVTVIVAVEDGTPKIRDVDFGRP